MALRADRPGLSACQLPEQALHDWDAIGNGGPAGRGGSGAEQNLAAKRSILRPHLKRRQAKGASRQTNQKTMALHGNLLLQIFNRMRFWLLPSFRISIY